MHVQDKREHMCKAVSNKVDDEDDSVELDNDMDYTLYVNHLNVYVQV